MIERIIIENFKSIRKLDLELRPINILVGANGAGKSNLISFFKLTNQIYEQRLQEYIGDNIDKLMYFGRKKSDYVNALIDFENEYIFSYRLVPSNGSNTGYLSALSLNHNSNGDMNKTYGSWEYVYGSEGLMLESHTNRKIISPEKGEHLGTILINSYLNSFWIYHFHDTGKDSPMKRMQKLNDNRYLKENGENLAAYLYYLQKKHLKDFQNIENQIRSIAPFFSRFDLGPDRLKEHQIELRWSEKNSDTYFNAYDLSDGTLRYIALTTLLMQPELPKVIIIDEPELGLHPFAINKLAAMLQVAAVKGSQVIISTQSTELISNFEPEDIVTVDRDKEQSIFRRLDSKELEMWLEDYTLGDLWTKNLIGAMP